MDPDYQHPPQDSDFQGPQPHPYLHDPLLHITNLPPYVSDENLAVAFMTCGPFRPKISRDSASGLLSGTIEFKFLEKGGSKVFVFQRSDILNVLLVRSREGTGNSPIASHP